MSRSLAAASIALLHLLVACATTAEREDETEDQSQPSRILISEVLAGDQGNNNYEFIELYNDGSDIVDLAGWSLVYRLPSSEEDLPLYQWSGAALVPPWGHYLLVREGQDLGLLPDAVFDQALNTSGGGLQLRSPDGLARDSIGWGNAPPAFVEGQAAPSLENGSSLARLGSQDEDDNASDFLAIPDPNPQNVGSPPTNQSESSLALELTAPSSVAPGEEFDYVIRLANEADELIDGVNFYFPIPAGLTVDALPEAAEIDDTLLSWSVPKLEPGEEVSITIPVSAPWSYFTAIAQNYYVRGDQPEAVTFGGPVWTEARGGSVPIDVARGLVGSKVVVEGITTMYTGGYFAGSGNVKFYMEDDTGGVQVWVPGGLGRVDVPIGATVRVTGLMEIYRGARELVTSVEFVEIMDTGSSWSARPVPIRQATTDQETLPGRLVEVVGTSVRVEEFNFSYEVDLVDEEGDLITLYLDKLTGMTAEPLDLGQRYRARGILELQDGNLRVYPRLQSDIAEVWPPILRLETDAPPSVDPGEEFTVTLTAYNHRPQAAEAVELWAPIPTGLVEILDGGAREGDHIRWRFDLLEGNGASVVARYRVQPTASASPIVVEDFGLAAQGLEKAVAGPPISVFLGEGVPIWAVQGQAQASPYKLEALTTTGTVTGVFPELGGFWIQNPMPDDDPTTSEGLFVATELELNDLSAGDLVDVTGRVREVSGQTQIEIRSLDDLVTIGSAALPRAIYLDPPKEDVAAAAYFESLEGMLVQVPGPAEAIGPTSRFGEFVVVLPEHAGRRVMRGDDAGMLITVDDGTTLVHNDRSTMTSVVSVGDQVRGLRGPLAYTFGSYKIEPLSAPTVTSSPVELPRLQERGPESFTLMTWNVENLFDILAPHPSSPPRPRKADYELSLDKVANTIAASGFPTVVALQEVENIGILEDLAAHPSLAVHGFIPVLIEGTDGRGIDVGFLIHGHGVNLLGVEQHEAPEGLTSRPPLVVQLKVETPGETVNLYVINNHFTSLAGGEAATEPRRNAQAAWNISIVEEILGREPEAQIAVLGDLNSFYDSLPIDTLRNAGLSHVFDVLPPEERYTYVFQGISQTLDHILVSSKLEDWLDTVHVLHFNADYALPELGDDSPLRKSDHDPVIAVFTPKD